MKAISRTIRDNHRGILCIFFFTLIALSLAGDFAVGTYTIYNDIQGTATLYSDEGDGVADRKLLSVGDRAYTVLRVVVDLTASEGLDHIDASLYTVSNTDGLGERLVLQTMNAITSLRYETTFSVDGFATGYYYIHFNGFATTHTIVVPNPDFPFDYYQRTDYYTDLWKQTGTRPPPEYLTEVKDDVDIFMPADTKVYVQNPAQPMEVSFDAINTDGVITFDFTVTKGTLSDALMVIYLNEYSNRILETRDIAGTIFNENKGQADGDYIASVYYTGAVGWIGGSKEVTFSIDNPDAISGICNIYIYEDNGWVLAEDVLKGDIKLVVTNLVGNPDRIYVTFDGVLDYEYDLVYDGTDDAYYVVIDTRSIINGVYDIQVVAVRSEDGALCYLNAWSLNAGSSTDSASFLILIFGLTGLAVILLTDERFMKFVKK